MKTKIISICLFFIFSISVFAQDDVVTEPLYATVRLGLHTQTNFYRQVLLGFMETEATDGVDAGYDAINVNNFDNDMYFLCGTTKLFIQGVGFFNTANSYPIGVTSTIEGVVKFSLEEITNLDPNQDVYIYDAVTGIYNDLKEKNYLPVVPAGVVDDRFSLRFFSTGVLATTNNTANNFNVFYANQILSLVNNNNINVKSIEIYNASAQQVVSLNKVNNQNKIQIPTSNLSTGIYIVKVISDNGVLSKKVLVN